MFRNRSGPVPAWESLLPPELLRLPEELARVDALLDDPVFFAPYFHPVPGRPSIPISTLGSESSRGSPFAARANRIHTH